LNETKRPRVGIGVLVEKNGKILLGLRKGSHGLSTWGPPGGHLEFGESVEECAKRELLEETGLKAVSCSIGHWVENLMENGQKHYISLFVTVDQFEGNPELLEPDKCQGWQWFSWDALPSPIFAPLSTLIELHNGQFEKSLKTVPHPKPHPRNQSTLTYYGLKEISKNKDTAKNY
jgi:8-oxo-dGTP diphosphatase